jgi:hypothetical protein
MDCAKGHFFAIAPFRINVLTSKINIAMPKNMVPGTPRRLENFQTIPGSTPLTARPPPENFFENSGHRGINACPIERRMLELKWI